MNRRTRKALALSLAAATVFAAGLIWNGKAALEEGFSSSAEARVGRPLTPMSYAGVARRTTRRAVVYGGAPRLPQPAPTRSPRDARRSWTPMDKSTRGADGHAPSGW